MGRTYGNTSSNRDEKQKKSRNKTGIIVGGMTIGLIFVIGIGCFVMSNFRNKETDDSNTIMTSDSAIDNDESFDETSVNESEPDDENTIVDNPEYTWFFVDEHYVNKNNPDDVIMLEELYALQDEWMLNYNPTLEKPIVPENPDEKYPDGKDSTGEDMPMDSLRADYVQKLAQYEAYCKAMYDPEYRGDNTNEYNPNTVNKTPNKSGTYKYVKAHYVNRYDFGQFIEVAEYENLVKEYEDSKSNGTVTDLPVKPMNPADLYRVVFLKNESAVIDGFDEYNFDTDGNYIGPKCPMSQEYERCLMDNFAGPYHQHRTPTGTVKDDFGGDSWFDINDNVIDITVENGTIIQNSGSSGVDGESDLKNIIYRNIFDGHILTYDEYNEAYDEYNESLSEHQNE